MQYPMLLTPLPRSISNTEAAPEFALSDGFVDDAVVDRMLAMPAGYRQAARSAPVKEDLVLSAGDDDYAGWHGGISPRMADRHAFSVPLSIVPTPSPVRIRRAFPPVMGEPGLDASYQSGHRWWLAAVAGAVASLTFATVLLSAAMRGQNSGSMFISRQTVPAAVAPSPAPVPSAPSAPKEITSRAEP